MDLHAEATWRLVDSYNLPFVSGELKNGSNSSYNCTPFLHSLLTKGKIIPPLWNWVSKDHPLYGFGDLTP